MTELLRSQLQSDSVQVSNANPCYEAVAKEPGGMHEMVNQSAQRFQAFPEDLQWGGFKLSGQLPALG